MSISQGRVVVLGLKPDGTGRVTRDEQLEPMPWPMKTGPRFDLWGSDEPVALPLADELPAFEGLFPPTRGVRFRMCEFSPGHGVDAPVAAPKDDDDTTEVPSELGGGDIKGLHATTSVDFGVLLSGEIDCVLESGETVHLGPGDSFVTLGALHRWVNDSSEPCVLAAVMLGCADAD